MNRLSSPTCSAATILVLLLVGSLALAQDNYHVFISNEYGADISVLSGASNEIVGTITISGRPGDVRPRGMALSPDGKTVYVSISDFLPLRETLEDKITAIDIATNEILTEIRAGGNPERVAISPDGSRLWASLEAIAEGGAYDAVTGEELATFRIGIEPEGVAVSPDGRWVYLTAETTHTVAVIDAQEMTTVKHFLVSNRPRVVVFSRDGSRAYVSGEIGGSVSVVDVSQHAVIGTAVMGLDSRPVGMALSPEGDHLYVAGGGTSAIYVIDTESLEVTKVIREQMGPAPLGCCGVAGWL